MAQRTEEDGGDGYWRRKGGLPGLAFGGGQRLSKLRRKQSGGERSAQEEMKGAGARLLLAPVPTTECYARGLGEDVRHSEEYGGVMVRRGRHMPKVEWLGTKMERRP